MSKIKQIEAREILASGGWPTIEAEVQLEDGSTASASVSYGASAGSKEAYILLDGDESRYDGKGMLKAVNNVENRIAPLLLDREANAQQELDKIMIAADGTANKSELGGNAILAVSMAVARAASVSAKLELYQYLTQTYQLEPTNNSLPHPMMVMIEGGQHADNSTDLQEYLITIEDDKGAEENVQRGLAVYKEVGKLLRQAGYTTNIGNEGAFAPAGIKNNEEPLEYLTKAIKRADYGASEIAIAIDAAASEFYQDGKYFLKREGQTLNAAGLLARYSEWLKKYPLKSIEDPLSEFDWDNWPAALEQLKPARIVADDITVTNAKLLQQGIDKKIANAIIIKLNQAGTVTETITACQLAKQNSWAIIPSHRGGGETKDTFLTDLAVATGAEYIKVGPTQEERIAKYDRLIEIEGRLKI
ncbi:MAG: phosphopyruvate hydratase [Patescibacteria group bacterium]|nr:phosphopyruvate hydratase [Patescibacteria group bacterium]